MDTSKVTLLLGDMVVDDRGAVRFVNSFDMVDVKRFYLVDNHQAGFIRAWHAHRREGKYVLVVEGAAIVAAVKIDDWDNPPHDSPVQRYVLSSDKPAVLWIPPEYANGFKSLTTDTKLIFFSTSSLDDSLNDDIRWDSHWFGEVWTVIER